MAAFSAGRDPSAAHHDRVHHVDAAPGPVRTAGRRASVAADGSSGRRSPPPRRHGCCAWPVSWAGHRAVVSPGQVDPGDRTDPSTVTGQAHQHQAVGRMEAQHRRHDGQQTGRSADSDRCHIIGCCHAVDRCRTRSSRTSGSVQHVDEYRSWEQTGRVSTCSADRVAVRPSSVTPPDSCSRSTRPATLAHALGAQPLELLGGQMRRRCAVGAQHPMPGCVLVGQAGQARSRRAAASANRPGPRRRRRWRPCRPGCGPRRRASAAPGPYPCALSKAPTGAGAAEGRTESAGPRHVDGYAAVCPGAVGGP